MGRRSHTGGVEAAGRERIQFTFTFEGVRYRPTLRRTATEANLRRARALLVGIKERIALGVFSLLLLLGASGCTWTETYNEFPPDVRHANHAHDASHPHHSPVME